MSPTPTKNALLPMSLGYIICQGNLEMSPSQQLRNVTFLKQLNGQMRINCVVWSGNQWYGARVMDDAHYLSN